jgi:hypothetical protein
LSPFGTAVRRSPASVRSSYKSATEVKAAMLTKLKDSKLTETDAKKLRFEPLTASEVAAKFSDLPAHRAGFRIPYFDLAGKPTKFYRIRYLEYGNDSGFAALTATTAKLLRYGQPADTLNEIYLPPVAGFDWQEYALLHEKPLLITEGELKAAAATKAGWPTLGLGGVWCFRSAANRLPILPAFADFNLKDRIVYIIYDSDAATNPNVMAAENALARELLLLGAHPYICRIPPGKDNAKVGLDDWLRDNDADDLKKEILDLGTEWRAYQELYALNEEVTYVKDPGVILKLDNLQRMAPRAFVDHAFSTRVYFEEQPTKDGTKLIEKSAPKEWLKWPFRSAVERVTYEPGNSRVTSNGELNVWKGWGCEPTPGDVRPWKLLLDYVFLDSPPEDREWFERWLAYPLQHPGTKLYSAVVVWSIHQGNGKSLMGYTMFKIYGANATEIADKELYSSHNEWAENKQFVMGDEIAGGEKKRDTADRMKSMITQKQLRLNPKYVPSYTVPDCINYYFTSNHPDAFFMEDRDRRFFVHELRQKPAPVEFYKTYLEWLNKKDGAAKLFNYFLTLDLKGFDPEGHAPATHSKREMIDSGRSDLGTWVATLRENPDSILKLGDYVLPYKLWTTSELYRVFSPDGSSRVTANGLARELRRAGFEKVWKGFPISTKSAKQVKLWAIRDCEAMLAVRKQPDLAGIYDGEREGAKVGRKNKF